MKEYRKELNKEERALKIERATEAYENFMDEILPGWQNDPNSRDTPGRVAKMFINELYSGLYGAEPKITAFENVDGFDAMVFSKGIEIKSQCSHHHMPFFGTAYIAYLPGKSGKIIGLSKLNRIAEFFARRPQVQENLTMQIHDFISKTIEDNLGVAVLITATHTCVSHRGARQSSEMSTPKLSGMFFNNEIGTRDEFYRLINNNK